MRLYELFQKEDKDNVTTLKPQTKGTKYPLFSKENAQKAYNEYYHGADVDRDIKIVGKDNKEYVIRQNRDGDSQHFDPGHWYLTDANNKIVDFESSIKSLGSIYFQPRGIEKIITTDKIGTNLLILLE